MTLALLPSVASPALADTSPGATPVASGPAIELAPPTITEATCDVGPAVTAPLSTDTVTYSDVTTVANSDATHTFTYAATVTVEGAVLPDALPDGYERTSDTLATYTTTLPEADCEPEMQVQQSESIGILSGGSDEACYASTCVSITIDAPDTIAPGETLTYSITFTRTGYNPLFHPDPFYLNLPGGSSAWSIGQNPGNSCHMLGSRDLLCYLLAPLAAPGASFTATVNHLVTERCGAVIMSHGGEIRNSPHVVIGSFSTTVVCPASPEDPAIEPGSCIDGAFVEPAISFPTTTGIAGYAFTPDPPGKADVITVTATLEPDYVWGDATGWTVSGDTATRDFPVSSTECSPDLAVTKAVTAVNGQPATSPVAGLIPGDVVAYQIAVENTGTAAIADLTVSDPGVTDLACDATLPVASFAPGATVTCTATHILSETDLITGSFTNTATASGTYDESMVSDSASAIVTTVDAETVITLEKSVSPIAVEAPGPVTYTFVIDNAGTLALSDLALVDDQVDLAALDCGGAGLPASLAAAASITCTVSYDITQEMLDAGGTIVNEATVSAVAANQDRVEATSSASLAVIQNPALTLEKTATTPEGEPVTTGTVITYAFTVTNGGTVTIDDIVVADALPGLVWDDANPGGAVGTLGPRESATITATYTVTADDADAGVVTNEAQAAGTRAGCAEAVTLRQEGGDRCGVVSGVASVSVDVSAPPTATATPTETATATATETVAVKVLPSTGHGAGPSAGHLAAVLLAAAALLGVGAIVTSRRWRYVDR